MRFKRCRQILTLIFLSFLFCLKFTEQVSAISVQPVDYRCWTEGACLEALKTVSLDDSNNKGNGGFVQNSDTKKLCGTSNSTGQNMGFCRPNQETQTAISFGGKKVFSDIGDFLTYSYKYAIALAGVLSVIVILQAGLMYIYSAGNTDTIKRAQKKIYNAISGLILAVGSYAILNAINPYLVNLKLPEVWMINPIPLDAGKISDCRTEGPLLDKCLNQGKQGEYVCEPYQTTGSCQQAMETSIEILSFIATLPTAALSEGALALQTGTGVAGQATKNFAIKTVTQSGAKVQNFFVSKFINPLHWVKNAAQGLGQVVKTGGSNAVQGWERGAGLEYGMIPEEALMGTGGQAVADLGKALSLGTSEVVKGAGTLGAITAGAGTVVGVTAVVLVSRDIYKAMNPPDGSQKGLGGFCRLSNKYPNGSICNTHSPQDCESGVCVSIKTGYECMVEGMDFGVCSAGENNSICDPNAPTCHGDLRCLKTTVWLSGITGDNITVCSDGKDRSPCEKNSDCKDKINGVDEQCLKVGNLQICAAPGSQGNEGMPCRSELSTEGGDCNSGLVCQNKDFTSPYKLKCVKPCDNDSGCAAGTMCKQTTHLQTMEGGLKKGSVTLFRLNQQTEFYQNFKLEKYCQSI